jgi:hypothetical protein
MFVINQKSKRKLDKLNPNYVSALFYKLINFPFHHNIILILKV